MTNLILFSVKYGIFTLFGIFVFLVLFALLGTLIHYLYAKKVYTVGDKFMHWCLKRQPDQIQKLLSKEYLSTTSLAEVVLYSETLFGFVPQGEKVIWHRTYIKKRRGHAVIHGAIYGKGKVRFNLVLTLKRGKSQRWKIKNIALTRNYSRSVDRSD